MNSMSFKSKSFKYLMWTVLVLTAQRIIVQYFNSIGLIIAIIAFLLFAIHIKLARKSYSLRNIDKDSRFIMLCLIIWSLITMFRGIYDGGIMSISNIAQYFTNAKNIMPYLLPFLAIYAYNKLDFKLFVTISKWLTISFILYAIISYNKLIMLNMIGLSHFSGIGVGDYTTDLFEFFVLLTSLIAPLVLFLLKDIISAKEWKFAALNILVAILVAVIAGRRSSTFAYGLVCVASYFVVFRKKASSTLNVFIISMVIIFSIYQLGFLDFFISKMYDDSRSGVEEKFYYDMDPLSWVWGRGALGTYYDPSPLFAHINGNRTEIETGYLNMILKGGIIYLALYLLVLLKAFYKGYFKTNNDFTKAFACICLITCIELIPYGIQSFNLKYLSIWIGVGLCLNHQVRQMTNKEIKEAFGL